MKVDNEIRIFAIDGEKTKIGDKAILHVCNVWNEPRLVELQFDNSRKIIVSESELMKAIKNATNI